MTILSSVAKTAGENVSSQSQNFELDLGFGVVPAYDECRNTPW